MKTELFSTPKPRATKLLNELREKKELVSLLEGLARGEKAILEDRTVPHSEARKRMSRWLD